MTASDSIVRVLETETARGNGPKLELYQLAKGHAKRCAASFSQNPWLRSRSAVPMTIHDIQRLVAARMGVTVLDLLSDRRSAARARQVGMWLARYATPASLPAIGRAFNRDRTTVAHACQRVDGLMAADPGFAAVISELRGAVA